MTTTSGARRAKGEGSVYLDEATGRWVGLLDLGRDSSGKRIRRKVTGKNKTEVTKRLRELSKAESSGLDVRRQYTVEALVRDWLAKAAGERRQASTMARLVRRLEDHLIPGVGAVRVDLLTVEHVEAWLQAEADKGQAASTLGDYRGDLRQVLRWAQRRRIVDWNVAEMAHLPKVEASAPKGSLTWEQRERLYAALADDRMGPYFTLLAEMGLRPGEADALTWADVDLDLGVVRISRAIKRDDKGVALEVGDTKTARSRRALRLSPVALDGLRLRRREQLAERMAYRLGWTDDGRWADLVFTSELGTPLNPSNVRRSLAKALKRAGLPPFTVYELRHTVASLLIDAGASPHAVADQLGHSDTRMLDKHYRHRIVDVVDTAAVVAEHRRASGDA